MLLGAIFCYPIFNFADTLRMTVSLVIPKPNQNNILQMIVNDEQVGRLQGLEIINITDDPFMIRHIIVDRCNSVRRKKGEGCEYEWQENYHEYM